MRSRLDSSAIFRGPSFEASASSDGRDRVTIFDTTLRDGEQSPGASMTLRQKIEIAAVLDEMGVDVIEAGFPIASEGDFEAVSEIASRTKRAIVCGLCRASKGDIERASEALRSAHRHRIHTFISTSPLHMKFKLRMTSDEVLDAVTSSVSFARSRCDDVEWSSEDGTRTDREFLYRCIEAAIDAGATTINIPDTVGYSTPEEYFDLIRSARSEVPNSDRATFSVHCHDDLGMATANSLAGIEAGARQIECTINGLGERAGNAALEEVVMAINVRGDRLAYRTGIDATRLTQASRLVSAASSFAVQPNKAIVGRNAFAHESGIHQDGMLKNASTYEIMTPESVGMSSSSLVMGKHSGRHAFAKKLEELGYRLSDNALQDAFVRFKSLADRKKTVYDEDIEALADDEISRVDDRMKVESISVAYNSGSWQRATVFLEIDGESRSGSGRGSGPIDALYAAVRSVYPHEASLTRYDVDSVTSGIDAQAEVSVRLEEGDFASVGRGVDDDTLLASVRAYVNALNRLSLKRRRSSRPLQSDLRAS